MSTARLGWFRNAKNRSGLAPIVAPDVTREFESALTGYLGQTADSALT